ncbi:MAG: hypothetical protein HY904_14985 [Deltaproteobacteria bacterium]|nr:hypothetical protein [Deltaproteobacteria bacterium]
MSGHLVPPILRVAALLAALATPVLATVVERLDLPALSRASARVVRGMVVARDSAWDPNGTRIVTRLTVDVVETLKGAPAARLDVTVLGGVVGEVGQWIPGEADARTGDHALFFLEPAGGGWRPTGMAQGVWTVSTDGQGALWVSRGASRLALVTPGSAPGPSARLPDRGEPPRPLDDVRALLAAPGGGGAP